MAKKKKEKIIYYDDGSTISDMSNVTQNGKKEPTRAPKKISTFGEKLKTYWEAVKMLVIPMCVALIVVAFLYFVMMFLGGNF